MDYVVLTSSIRMQSCIKKEKDSKNKENKYIQTKKPNQAILSTETHGKQRVWKVKIQIRDENQIL